MIKTLFYILSLFTLFPVWPGVAQEKMSLQKCREMALQKNEEMQVAEVQMEKARAQKEAAKTNRLPAFSLSGTGIYQFDDFEMDLDLPTKRPDPLTGKLEPNVMRDPSTGEPVIGPDGNPVFNMYAWLPLSISLKGAYLAGIALEQPLYTGGRIAAGNEMAHIGMDMAGENRKLQRMNALEEADRAYWNFVSVNEKVKLAQKAVDLLEAIIEKVRDSYEVGMAHKNELLKAQVEYNSAALELQKAKNGLEISRMELCRITGLSFHSEIIALDTIVEVGQALQPVENEAHVSRRPEFGMLKKNIDLKEQNIRLKKAEFLPSAGIQAGYNYMGGIEFSDKTLSHSGFNVMASVNIPLFHWGEGVKKISSAKMDKRIAELRLEKNRQLMELETEQVRLNLEVAHERILLCEKALEQAEENRRVIRDNYEVGMETMTELLKAQTQWQEAYSNLIDSRTDYKMKETAWMKVTGRLELEDKHPGKQ